MSYYSYKNNFLSCAVPGTICWESLLYYMLLLLLLLSRFSHVRLCATPQMAAHQAPPSTGFSRQEYWSGVPLSVVQNSPKCIQAYYSPLLAMSYVEKFYRKQTGSTLINPAFPKLPWELTFPAKLYFTVWRGGGGGGSVTQSCPTLATPWTVALQALLSRGFSRQGYWSGLPFPSLYGEE